MKYDGLYPDNPRDISNNMGFGCPFLVTILKRGCNHPVFVGAAFLHLANLCLATGRMDFTGMMCFFKVTPLLWTLTNIKTLNKHSFETQHDHEHVPAMIRCPWSDVSVIWSMSQNCSTYFKGSQSLKWSIQFKSASWFYQKLSETNKQKSSIQQAFIAAITPG